MSPRGDGDGASKGATAVVDAVLFESDGVRVTTRRVVAHGRSWGLEYVRAVTVSFQSPAERLLRMQAVLVGALLLIYGLAHGLLAAFVRDGGLGGVALGVAAVISYAALARRLLRSECTCVWLHTRYSSQLVYRGRSRSTARALARVMRRALSHRRTAEAREDAA
ncbi:hypothetical protein JY651_29650 [Pyxidicoccus parkwayensis]|uniref:Uncharacterized protein n=1 Tax=Pyxidicoccus parkwayensis TaxID=2813578 RepID=A0ABX7NKT9_9BACT|nr:DUF6232 family protein [Pyxidicoccus parkwaysis]QSQ19472.1 hypothetical protein JY651_29650 [Pyxidicoccus parkwaysis]